ncbi:MFS transporter (plasmid) [Mesorhizobium muleiense]|uniref:MFS transporter n=1 Tax=Mesorhizobium muleiense TaxID=1004279 RepID=UPI003AFA4B0A
MAGVHTYLSHRRAIAAVGFQFFINGVVFAAWATNIPHVRRVYGLNSAEIGIVLLIMAAGAVLFMSLTGYLVQVFGSRRISILSALLFPAALGLVFAVPNYLAFLCSIVLFGAANGSMDVSMNHQAAMVEKYVSVPIMSLLHGFFSIGALAGSFLTFGFIGGGLHPVTQAIALLTGILVVAWWLFPHLVVDAAADTSSRHTLAIGALRDGKLFMFGILSFLTMMSDGAIADWSTEYLIHYSKATPQTATLGYAVFSLLMIAGRMSGDRVVRAIGCRALMAISGSLASAGMTIALFTPSFAAQLVGFALVGLGIANMVPIIFSNAARVDSVPPSVGIAFVSVCGYSGFVVGPPVIGGTAHALGLDRALLVIIAIGVIVACASVIFGRRRSRSA